MSLRGVDAAWAPAGIFPVGSSCGTSGGRNASVAMFPCVPPAGAAPAMSRDPSVRGSAARPPRATRMASMNSRQFAYRSPGSLASTRANT